MLQLSQRITARYHLGPLSRKETFHYVRHRLTVAGYSRGRLFPPATLRRLYRLTRGVPRLINVICDRALLGAYVQEKDRVDPKTLKQAAREALGRRGATLTWSAVYPTVAALLLLFLAAGGTAFFLYRHWPWSVPLPPPATASRPPEAKVRPEATADLGWPENLNGEQTRRLAQAALVKLWQIELKPGDFCRQAAARDLRCLQGRGSLTSLRQMNKPAVLTLVDEAHGPFYATLTALQGRTATIVVGTAPRVVGIEAINRLWSGEYLLLWRAPPGYRGELKPGSRGPQVVWMKRQLALARGQAGAGEPDPRYDPDCLRQVKKFQLAAGLVPDGIVGPKTIMPLSAAAGSGEPVLHDGKGVY
jgi:general secretion pathway protein A